MITMKGMWYAKVSLWTRLCTKYIRNIIQAIFSELNPNQLLQDMNICVLCIVEWNTNGSRKFP